MKKNKKYYKILANDISPFVKDIFRWDIPVKRNNKWIPGNWAKISGDLILLINGIHVTDNIDRWKHLGNRVFEVEIDGEYEVYDDEALCRKVRLISEVLYD